MVDKTGDDQKRDEVLKRLLKTPPTPRQERSRPNEARGKDARAKAKATAAAKTAR